jgi:ADP-ribose pyrophosphatase YjhB (NUDIX family)
MWKEPAVPRTAVQVIPIDIAGDILMMHRSNNVRSARNVWSFPSGLHDIGELSHECGRRELQEEYGLIGIRHTLLGVYENIAGDSDAVEQYHWLIVLMGVLVQDVNAAINKEPEKHDQMKTLEAACLEFDWFWDDHPFHPSFDAYGRLHREAIVKKLYNLLEE